MSSDTRGLSNSDIPAKKIKDPTYIYPGKIEPDELVPYRQKKKRKDKKEKRDDESPRENQNNEIEDDEGESSEKKKKTKIKKNLRGDLNESR